MNPMTISLITFACVFGGSLFGIVLRMIIPERQFSPAAQDVIKLGLALISTMNGLVLGLLISTAKTSYDTKRALLAQIASDVILVDRSLALYGSEAKTARIALYELVGGLIDQVQSIRSVHDLSLGTPPSESSVGAVDFYQIVQKLSPHDDEQRMLKAEVLRLSLDVAQIRASALTKESSSIPLPFLIVLIFWLAILFTGFGLFAPPNITVEAALCVFALSVAAAIYMIVEMDEAFVGVMHISTDPLRNAMIIIGRQTGL